MSRLFSLTIFAAFILVACSEAPDSGTKSQDLVQRDSVSVTANEPALDSALDTIKDAVALLELVYKNFEWQHSVDPYEYCTESMWLQMLHHNWIIRHPFYPFGDAGYEWLDSKENRRITHYEDSNWVRVELYRGEDFDEWTVFEYEVVMTDKGPRINDMRPKVTDHLDVLNRVGINHEQHIVLDVESDSYSFVHFRNAAGAEEYAKEHDLFDYLSVQDGDSVWYAPNDLLIWQTDDEYYDLVSAPFYIAEIVDVEGNVYSENIEERIDSLQQIWGQAPWRVEDMSVPGWRLSLEFIP